MLSKTYKKLCIKRCERRARGSKSSAQKMEIEQRCHGEEELEIIVKLAALCAFSIGSLGKGQTPHTLASAWKC